MGGLVFLLVKEFQKPVPEQERAWVVGAPELVPYFEGFAPDASDETMKRLHLLGRLLELNYEYESESDEEPYINTLINEKGSTLGARKDMLIQWKTFEITARVHDMEVRENNDFYQVGDSSRFADLLIEGELLGHLLLTRKGNFIYMFTISGYIMPESEIWHELFDLRIEALQ